MKSEAFMSSACEWAFSSPDSCVGQADEHHVVPLSQGSGAKRHEPLHQCGKEARPLCSGDMDRLTTAEEFVKFANRLWLGRRGKTQLDISQRFCDDWRLLYDTDPPVGDDGCPEDFLMNPAYSCPNPPPWLADLLPRANPTVPTPLVPQTTAINSTPDPGDVTDVANAQSVYSVSSGTSAGTSSVVHRQHNISGSEWCFVTKAPCYVNQRVSWVGPGRGNPERRANVVCYTLLVPSGPSLTSFDCDRSVFLVIRVLFQGVSI